MGEEGVREALRRDIADVFPEFTVLRLREPMSPDDFLHRCVALAREATIMAGVPKGYGEKLTKCTIVAALAYTAEDIVQGSRIRNKSILFLINLLGKKQIKDIINEINNIYYIIIINKYIEKIKEICGGDVTEIKECNEEWLLEMSGARIRRYAG